MVIQGNQELITEIQIIEKQDKNNVHEATQKTILKGKVSSHFQRNKILTTHTIVEVFSNDTYYYLSYVSSYFRYNVA